MHPPVFRALVIALTRVFRESQYADQALENIFRENRKFGSRDRRALAESFYELVRHFRLISAWAKSEDIAVIAEKFLAEEIDPLIIQEQMKSQAPEILYSISDELFERIRSERPGDYLSVISSLNKPARVYLRVNKLKSSRNVLMNLLREEGVESSAVEDFPDAIALDARKNLATLKCFEDGLFEIQDLGSQQLAPWLDVNPGDFVIDACAGAGGKTLQLAAAMKCEGNLIAMDIDESRLFELKRRAKRAGAHFVDIKTIDEASLSELSGKASHLLLDAPCSGSGTLRRKLGMKYKISNNEIDNYYCKLQAEILNSYSKLVRPGGTLVYATCSILPSENQLQIQKFLKNQSGQFNLVDEKEILPFKNDTDGFFISKLKRKEK